MGKQLGRWYNLPQPKHQRSTKVSVWFVVLLLALCTGEAATIWYLFKHRTMQFNLASSLVEPAYDPDALVTHAFPPKRTVCTLTDTICYIKI